MITAKTAKNLTIKQLSGRAMALELEWKTKKDGLLRSIENKIRVAALDCESITNWTIPDGISYELRGFLKTELEAYGYDITVKSSTNLPYLIIEW